jgi:lysophospholipase L1-like esterase
MTRIRPHFSVFIAIVLAIASQRGFAQATNWIGTWGTASYAQVATSVGQSTGNFTYRNIVRASVGGTAVRVQLTNEFGTSSLIVGPVQLAISAGNGAIESGTNVGLTFGGSPTVTIPPGAVAFSDPLAFTVPAMANLAVSAYFPAQTILKSVCHPNAQTTSYTSAGNTVAQAAGGTAVQTWCYLRGIDIENANAGTSIVAIGDSITDGYQSPVDGNKRYTDFLAAALQANPSTANIGVLNKGILANELLGEDGFTGYGSAGLARLTVDVFGQTGVSYVIVLEGINDLGYASPVDSMATADALIASYQQLIAQAHSHGIKVYGGTITPVGGTGYYSWTNDAGRQAVNAWIRTSGAFDAVIDFDAVLTNGAVAPAIPALQKQYDSGDHLHPNALGYQAMANAISLSLFDAQSSTTKK